MGSRTFTLMAIVFLALGASYWWFNIGPGRPDAAARSFTVMDAWPNAVRMVRPTLREASNSLERSGVPRIVAPALVVIGVLLLGYLFAWAVLRAVSGLVAVSGLFQVVIVPIWQIGLTLVSAAQTVEWLQERGLFGSASATPAYIGYTIVSLVMLYGLSKVRTARA
jgi:hypothetical protein